MKASSWMNQFLSTLASIWGKEYSYNTLPPEKLRVAAKVPLVREHMIRFSCDEYDRNPYYSLVIENLANHTLGSHPQIIGMSDKVPDKDNDRVEDNYLMWVSENSIGRHYREIRRQAAKTGLGIGVPFKNPNTDNPVATSYKVYGANCLKNPIDAGPQDRIINGIEYNQEWEPVAFFIDNTYSEFDKYYKGGEDTKEYRVEEVIYWSRSYVDGRLLPIPECYSAFQFYPYLRRFLAAVIEGEEFTSSFPMAIELDPQIYKKYSQSLADTSPTGSWEYEPRMIPTLRPGMKLTGMPHSVSSKDREKTMQMFAATCALTVQMPKNLALLDSSNSNMASAQVDIQPWANKVAIDRFDMEPMLRKSFKDWWAISVQREMNYAVRANHLLFFPHVYVYPDLFEHPDPNKRAGARATDLISGATTLNRMYSNRGMNFRREVEREAKALGIPVEDLIKLTLASRSSNALSILQGNVDQEEDDDAKKSNASSRSKTV